MNKNIENHPIPFFLPPNAKLLMLGSFPPQQKRWSMDFFYPNLQNDMWRIFGLLFFNDKEHFLVPNKKAFDKQRIMDFASEKGIAFGDTAQKVIRLKDNASDNFLKIVEPIDLPKVLSQMPECRAIVTTGEKATDTLVGMTGAEKPAIGQSSGFTFEGRAMKLYRMPSSSRAYPKPLPEKAVFYAGMFKALGILN